MTTKTGERKFVRPTLGDLPPICVLPIGGKPAVGEITRVELADEIFYYRLKLEEPTEGMKKDSDETVTFEAGQEVSIIGSGGLNYQMLIAAAKFGKDLEWDASNKEVSAWYQPVKKADDDDQKLEILQAVVGKVCQLERHADEKLEEGKQKGKLARNYVVSFVQE